MERPGPRIRNNKHIGNKGWATDSSSPRLEEQHPQPPRGPEKRIVVLFRLLHGRRQPPTVSRDEQDYRLLGGRAGRTTWREIQESEGESDGTRADREEREESLCVETTY